MEHVLQAYCTPEETVTVIIMLYKNQETETMIRADYTDDLALLANNLA